MASRSSDDDVELDRLVASFERLVVLLRRLTEPAGLSLTAASALHRLAETGPHRLSDLAAAEGLTQPGMTQLVTRLERDGLAVRGSDPADRRVVLVQITPAGRAVWLRRRRERVEALSRLLADMPDEDRVAVFRSLEAMDRLVVATSKRGM